VCSRPFGLAFDARHRSSLLFAFAAISDAPWAKMPLFERGALSLARRRRRRRRWQIVYKEVVKEVPVDREKIIIKEVFMEREPQVP
jgi:hypothetical protein